LNDHMNVCCAVNSGPNIWPRDNTLWSFSTE
jgi:hypothetical protein